MGLDFKAIFGEYFDASKYSVDDIVQIDEELVAARREAEKDLKTAADKRAFALIRGAAGDDADLAVHNATMQTALIEIERVALRRLVITHAWDTAARAEADPDSPLFTAPERRKLCHRQPLA